MHAPLPLIMFTSSRNFWPSGMTVVDCLSNLQWVGSLCSSASWLDHGFVVWFRFPPSWKLLIFGIFQLSFSLFLEVYFSFHPAGRFMSLVHLCLDNEFGLFQLDMPSSLQERLQWEFLSCLLIRIPTSWKLMNGLPTFRFCLDYALVEQFCSSFFNYMTILHWYDNDMIIIWCWFYNDMIIIW